MKEQKQELPNDVREDDVDTPMVKRLKDHLNSITPEQFNKEIDDINKKMGYDVNDNLTRLLDLYIEKTGYGMDMWSKEENAIMTTIAEIVNEQAKENTYTEEQVREAIESFRKIRIIYDYEIDEIIQSLKQPK